MNSPVKSTPEVSVLLLGASNVSQSISRIVSACDSAYRVPLEIRAALGHGRSYIRRTRVGWRRLPSIAECQLWPACGLQQSEMFNQAALTSDLLDRLVPVARTQIDHNYPIPMELNSEADHTPRKIRALITDIGNDVIYGSMPEKIISQIMMMIERIESLPCLENREILVTRLPWPSVRKVAKYKYESMVRLLFPRTQLTWEMMLERVEEMDHRLQSHFPRSGVTLVEQSADWYGFDPIHILRRKRARVWSEILGHWSDFQISPRQCRSPLLNWVQYGWAMPDVWWWGETLKRTPQPARRSKSGHPVYFY
jgi:hypothetical protein